MLDGSLRTLGDAELFAYLCVHGASHCWFRLKWLADLNAWLAGQARATRSSASTATPRRWGSGPAPARRCVLCNRLLGLALAAGAGAGAERRRLRMLVAAALDAMVGADAETELARRPFGPVPHAAGAVPARPRRRLLPRPVRHAVPEPGRHAEISAAARAALPLSVAAPAASGCCASAGDARRCGPQGAGA